MWYTRPMRAWRVHEFGAYSEVLKWEECPDPTPPAHGVLIDVAASGVNFPDMLAIAGKYQIKAPLPFTPGVELSGVVKAAGASSKFEVGDRVVATAPWGAHAEQVAINDATVLPIPDQMTDVHAAALMVTYQTSWVALTARARLEAGEVLLVHGGAGGVGSAAVQLGKILGATVIATAGSDAKLQVCRDAGADHVINYRETDFVAAVKEITKGRGANVIYDPVGGDVFDKSTKCLAWSGRLLVIGFASGRIPEVQANRVLLKNIAIVGVHWGAYLLNEPQAILDAHEALCNLYAEGKFAPIIYADMAQSEYPAALDALRGRESYGKIVLHRG